MSARSLLFGLLIGAAGATGLAFTNSAALGIGPAAQESSDAASQFGSGSAAAPGRQQSSTQSPTDTAPTTSSATSSSVPTTTTPPTTTPPPQTTSAPPQTTKPPVNKAPEQQVLALVNQVRSEAGCKPLVVDDRITTAAQGHSTDMATRDYFSHDTPEGVDFAERMKDAGYSRPGGENIAMGQRSAEQVMESWMNSSGHRANILNCSFTAMGVGLDTRGWYWTQNFGR